MKNRTGFVSNSSSASFVINWRMKTFGQDLTLKKAISVLFDSYIYKEETDEWVAGTEWDKKDEAKFEEIANATVINKNDTFTTKFFTNMKNDMDDFGEAAKSLVINLVGNENFEIIDAKVEDE